MFIKYFLTIMSNVNNDSNLASSCFSVQGKKKHLVQSSEKKKLGTVVTVNRFFLLFPLFLQ